MNHRRWQVWIGTAVAGLLAALAARGQAGAEAGAAARPGGAAQALPALPVLRVIEDTRLGNRWLLYRDPRHPGGPGRLVLAAGERFEADGVKTAPDAPPPMVRAGDRLIVEEHTPVVEARLEAVAMGPAWIGSRLQARLKIGGRVVEAVVVGEGRAMLDAGPGVGR